MPAVLATRPAAHQQFVALEVLRALGIFVVDADA